MPLFLAGGINNENVADILKKYAPDFIDLASGLESAAGVKDGDKITRFFNQIKGF